MTKMVLMKKGPYSGQYLKLEDDEASKVISDGFADDPDEETKVEKDPEKRAAAEQKAYEESYAHRLDDVPEFSLHTKATKAAREKAKADEAEAQRVDEEKSAMQRSRK